MSHNLVGLRERRLQVKLLLSSENKKDRERETGAKNRGDISLSTQRDII